MGRDGARTPMPWEQSAPFGGFSASTPWLPLDPAHLALAVDRQEADPGATLHLARRLIALRQSHAALRTGALEWLDLPEPLLGFDRIAQAARLRCLFNLSSTAHAATLDGWRPLIRVGENAGAHGIAPYGAIIAESIDQ
jgi:alpha-glucosidase